MSFDKLTLGKLREAALSLGAVLEEEDAKKMKKAELLAALQEEGASFQDWENFSNLKAHIEAAEEGKESGTVTTDDFVKNEGRPVEVQSGAKPVQSGTGQMFGEMLLIKMERENFSFDIPSKDGKGRWHWSKEHPFQPMPQSEATYVLDKFDGFRIASPTEAKEYYG